MEKKCIQCGKVFRAERESARFCSSSCRGKYSRREDTGATPEVDPDSLPAVFDKMEIGPFSMEAKYRDICTRLKLSTPTIPATFSYMLKYFNYLVTKDKNKISRELDELREDAGHTSDLNENQKGAIVDRIRYLRNGEYKTKFIPPVTHRSRTNHRE